MSHALVYWVTRLDILTEIITALLVLSSLIVGTAGLARLAMECDNELNGDAKVKKVLNKILKPSIIVLLITMLLKCFIPTTGEACLIYTLPKIANSNVVQNEVPAAINNIFKLANKCLEDKMKDYTDVKE
jgi:hypothetical protein